MQKANFLLFFLRMCIIFRTFARILAKCAVLDKKTTYFRIK